MILLPCLTSAKRVAPVKVEPAIHEGIRYVVPNDNGYRAYIEAWDVRTNKKLWDLTVFTNRIDPKLEEDVQWVFINDAECSRWYAPRDVRTRQDIPDRFKDENDNPVRVRGRQCRT